MSKLTGKQKVEILRFTRMSKELLEESINNDSLHDFGGNATAENLYDRLTYSIEFYGDYCLLEMWRRERPDIKWKIFTKGAS